MSTPPGWTARPDHVLRADAATLLNQLDTRAKPGFEGNKKDGVNAIAARGKHLAALQERLYAAGRSGDQRRLLLVLQGMDTAGKGSMVKHVIGLVDPQGVGHHSFGPPTPEELGHHFLWRVRKAAPRPGQLGVFDRSHYEDVLVARVHNLVPQPQWEARYDEINEFEAELAAEGTTIVKVALFVSLDEQRRRLQARLRNPAKYWKFSPSDIDERALWPSYQAAYQAVLDRTNTDVAPWFVVPCDRKWYSRVAVTELLITALENLDLDWPPADFDVAEQLRRLRDG